MRKFFDVLTVISVLALLSRYVGVDFVTQHYWWFICPFLIGVIGKTICDKTAKRKDTKNTAVTEQ